MIILTLVIPYLLSACLLLVTTACLSLTCLLLTGYVMTPLIGRTQAAVRSAASSGPNCRRSGRRCASSQGNHSQHHAREARVRARDADYRHADHRDPCHATQHHTGRAEQKLQAGCSAGREQR